MFNTTFILCLRILIVALNIVIFKIIYLLNYLVYQTLFSLIYENYLLVICNCINYIIIMPLPNKNVPNLLLFVWSHTLMHACTHALSNLWFNVLLCNLCNYGILPCFTCHYLFSREVNWLSTDKWSKRKNYDFIQLIDR